MSFSFSFGNPQDTAPVKRLLADCGLPYEDVDNQIENFLIARSGDALAGTVALEPGKSSALLRSLAVADKYRGQGLAPQLVDRILAHAHATGIETLYLLTLTAGEFFRRRGFATTNRSSAPKHIAATREFTTLCPDTAEFMIRELRHEARYPADTART